MTSKPLAAWIPIAAGAIPFMIATSCGQPPEPPPPAAEPNPAAQPAVVETPSSVAAPAPAIREKTVRKALAPGQKPKRDAALSADQRRGYREALKEGRELHLAKDYAGAVAAFDRALAIREDDARALGEKGWAQFQAGDLAGAEKSTVEAIARTSNKKFLGGMHYNMGRIHEQRGAKERAVASYRRSLEVRPGNEVVTGRLTRLGGAVPTRNSFTGVAPAGPFPDLAAACDSFAKRAQADDADVRIHCGQTRGEPDEGTNEPIEKTVSGQGAILEARFVETPLTWSDDGWSTESYYHLVLRTAAGWYWVDELAYVYNPGAFGIYEELSVETLALRQIVPGGEPELEVSFTHSRMDSDMGLNEVEEWQRRVLIVCGVGGSGAPTCTEQIGFAESASRGILIEEDEGREEFEHDPRDLYDTSWKLSYAFDGNGAVVLTGDFGRPKDPIARALLGAHPLVFP